LIKPRCAKAGFVILSKTKGSFVLQKKLDTKKENYETQINCITLHTSVANEACLGAK